MSRLIVISNRAPALDPSSDAGGLVVALRDVLAKQNGIWIGTNEGEEQSIGNREIRFHDRPDFRVGYLDLTPAEVQSYYLGYSNSILWPAFHSRLDLMQVEPGYLEGHQKVLSLFADALMKVLQPSDTVWIHDYHLVPLANLLKQRGLQATFGFFLHIPVPDVQTFLSVPGSENLCSAFSAYDLIGLQTQRDTANLRLILQNVCHAELLPSGKMKIADRKLSIKSYPISIDVEEFADTAAKHPKPENKDGQFRIIGVDRLDYSKGLTHRLDGFRTFLDRNPDMYGKVNLLQIAPPSRTEVTAYAEIREQLDGLTGSINGDFGTVDWVPVQTIYKSFPRDELAGIYRHSQVGIVTSLFDGMNLVAKEYVTAQDPENPGVLLLSQFAGAAEQMQEALIINPHDPVSISDALAKAVNMTLQERQERHDALFTKLKRNDIHWWSRTYLKDLKKESNNLNLHYVAPKPTKLTALAS